MIVVICYNEWPCLFLRAVTVTTEEVMEEDMVEEEEDIVEEDMDTVELDQLKSSR